MPFASRRVVESRRPSPPFGCADNAGAASPGGGSPLPALNGSPSSENAHGLQLRVHLDTDSTVLAPDPGLLVAAERHVRVDRAVTIHPNGASANAGNQPMDGRDVVRPDARG